MKIVFEHTIKTSLVQKVEPGRADPIDPAKAEERRPLQPPGNPSEKRRDGAFSLARHQSGGAGRTGIKITSAALQQPCQSSVNGYYVGMIGQNCFMIALRFLLRRRQF